MKRKQLYPRERYLSRMRGFVDETEIIKVLSGVRRCGKSSLLLLLADELRAKGVEETNIVFLNLDKRPYRGIKTPDQLDGLIASKLPNNEDTVYLFLDEIQNVDGFEGVVNAYREEGNISLFLTGSNSYLLSGELATKLTGRYVLFEIETLTFPEYLDMKRFLGLSTLEPHEEFQNYLREGGFPYAVHLPSKEEKDLYLENLTREIFEKDIYARAKIRDRALFENVSRFIINNFGATVSIDKLCAALKRDGKTPSKRTIYRYLELLQSAKIIARCPRFDLKSKRSLSGEEKYYLSDLGFYFARNVDHRINYGPVLENVVYAFGKASGLSMSVGKIGKAEVDFIARKGSDYAYLQVAMTIYGGEEDDRGIPMLENREYRPLEAIRDNYPKIVLTLDTLLQRRGGIRHENLVDWMLNGGAI